MYYLEVDDEKGVDTESILIIKDLGNMKYCGCRFSYRDGVLNLEKRKFYKGDFKLHKCDYEDFHFYENFDMERLYLKGLGDFPLDQFDDSVFDYGQYTDFEMLVKEEEE